MAQLKSSVVKEGYRNNARGQKLFTVTYRPHVAQQAVYIHAHGYGEHVGGMHEYFSALAAGGIAVHSFDHHGHGKSEPVAKRDRVFVNKFSDLVDDMEAFAREVAAAQPPDTPLFMGGQSMGGLIALHTVLRRSIPWRGLVLTSALVDMEWNTVLRLQSKVGNLLAAIMPRARIVPGVDPKDLSQDAAVVKAFVDDPLNDYRWVRARTANELLKAFRVLGRHQQQLKLPIFAVHGTADRTTSLPAVRSLLAGCASTDTDLKAFEGGYHALVMGPEKDEVFASVRSWILDHAAAPSTAPMH